jgi:hypothetical protein
MLSSCYLALNDLDNARKYGELAAFSGMAKRAEPLYFLAFYLSQRSQYSLAWYYASLAAKIPKPAISAALFISNDIYNYWVDYELASLSRHIFPSQPTLGMQAAMAFWNNGYAPDWLRWSFSSFMKSYVRPIMASASDIYRYTGDGESVPLAIFRNSGIVKLLTAQTQAGADSSVQTFKIVEVDIHAKHVREMGVINWRMDALSEHGAPAIMWQFMEPRNIFGVSPSGSQVYHGDWPEPDDYAIPMHMHQIPVEAGELLKPPFGTAIGSLLYRGDLWFLLRVDALDAFGVVVLGPDFYLKAYTPPFTLGEDVVEESNEKETPLGFSIVMSGDGKENVVFAYTSHGDVVIKQLPLETMLTLML